MKFKKIEIKPLGLKREDEIIASANCMLLHLEIEEQEGVINDREILTYKGTPVLLFTNHVFKGINTNKNIWIDQEAVKMIARFAADRIPGYYFDKSLKENLERIIEQYKKRNQAVGLFDIEPNGSFEVFDIHEIMPENVVKDLVF